MGEALKPPFTYFGGKLTLAERIAALLPPHQHYVEPFAGSLAVLLAKPPSPMETVNDLDGRPDVRSGACCATARASLSGPAP